MKLKRILLVVSCLMLGIGSFAAQATTAEPTLRSILKTEYNGTWTRVSFADLSGKSWNTAGTTLTFSLISENADWAGINSFSIKDGASTYSIFAGTATPSSPAVSYVIKSGLTSFVFKTGATQVNQYRIYLNPLGEYAIGYEDTVGRSSDRDYNDMVITLKATPVVAVPEPESVSLMMAGLGLMGLVARRRKKVAA